MSKLDRDLEHIWHVWMNRRQEEERKSNPDHKWEHSLYEFKNMLQFLASGHRSLQEAFEGRLPTIHQQCSHSAPIPIVNNVLKCARGTEVTTCPILLQLKDSFDRRGKGYDDIPAESIYRLMAQTCAWHIYTRSVNSTEGFGGIDTSMGYVMDTSDRMFWDTIHSNMAMSDPEDDNG
jgi:hypothetical protein